MVQAFRTEMVIEPDGKLSIDHLPFETGQKVEVIILPTTEPSARIPSLEGTVLHYDRPTDPVVEKIGRRSNDPGGYAYLDLLAKWPKRPSRSSE
jgi:hypothetical protein